MNLSLAPTRHLTECFSELFAYVTALRQHVLAKQPDYSEVRNHVMALLKQSESFVAQGLYTMDEYDQARFAICAWVDETIMGSPWSEKGRWRPEMLQRVYYQSTDGGEKFFQRLKNLSPQQQAVREVFTLCLALGFKGRYCAPDDGYALEQLKDRQMKWLFNSVSEVPTPAFMEKNTLFPEAYAKTAMPSSMEMKGRILRLWIAALLGPSALLCVLLMVYWLMLSHVGRGIQQVLP